MKRFREIVAAAVVCLCAALAAAQEDADCLKCHGDPAAKPVREGGRPPKQVDVKALAASPHAKQNCVYCHQDLDGTDFPHKPDVEPADCAACHEKEGEAHARSLHGQAHAKGDPMAPTCAECHGSHDVKPPKDPASPVNHMNIPLLCGKCHHEGSPVSRTHDIPQDRILENYSEGMHGEGLFKKGLSVTAVCTSCHTSHDILPHTDPRSSIHHEKVAQTCAQCHTRIEQVHRKVIEGKLWESEPNKIPACVDCHQPHKVRRVDYPTFVANRDCLSCHGKTDLPPMTRGGQAISLFVDEAAYADSTHKTVGCAQCHTDVDPSHTERPCATVKKQADCSACHAEVVGQYQSSVHGTTRNGPDPVKAADAPVCLDCHSKHATQSKKTPGSPTYPRNVPNLCARCHQEGKQAARWIESDVPNIPGAYTESIHGKGLLESGLVVTATCVSCHTAHSELPPSDPRSTVNEANVAATCGTCHNGIEAALKTSVHWPGNTDTKDELPTCNDCHSSHTISRTDRDDFRFRILDQCGRCHEEQAETFFETFHGKVSLLHGTGAAQCFDCHGTHGILPPSNPASTLSSVNAVGTCAKCHEGAHAGFTTYLTHATHRDPERYPWLFGAFWAMTSLLAGTMAAALLHTGMWSWRLWRTRDEWKAHRASFLAARKAPGVKLFRRFDRYQRMQHLVMLVSFFTLALTGMTLKFSYAGWAKVLSPVFGGTQGMNLLHRLAGVTLLTVFTVHVLSLARHRRETGKTWMQLVFGADSLMFNRRDWEDLKATMRWFAGRGPRPRYGRFTYWEKFDYFAVFWGVAVIGLTGLMLWFPEIATYVLPGPAINVATIIHSDEALLAVVFIFTIHFFNANLRPDKFPMDPVMFTGRMTVEELRHEKPDEYERLVATGELEKHLVEPFPARVEKGFRAFGAVALTIGLTLVALILYALVFHW